MKTTLIVSIVALILSISFAWLSLFSNPIILSDYAQSRMADTDVFLRSLGIVVSQGEGVYLVASPNGSIINKNKLSSMIRKK